MARLNSIRTKIIHIGEWDSNWGHMILKVTGLRVYGTYSHDNGRI